MGVHFAALPMGHEFTSLLLALLWAGGHPPKVEPEVIEQIKALARRFQLHHLDEPDLPQLPGRGAGAQPHGRAQPARPATSPSTAACFRRRSKRRRILAVPKTEFLNGAELLAAAASSWARSSPRSTPAPRSPRGRQAQPTRQLSTCWSSAVARLALPPRCTPHARASAPASWPSASVARPWTPWASRTSSPCRTPRARSSPPRWKQHVREYERRHHDAAARRPGIEPAAAARRPTPRSRSTNGADPEGQARSSWPPARAGATMNVPGEAAVQAPRAWPTARTATARSSRARTWP